MTSFVCIYSSLFHPISCLSSTCNCNNFNFAERNPTWLWSSSASTDSARSTQQFLAYIVSLAVGWWSEHTRVLDAKGHIVQPVRDGRAYWEYCLHCCNVIIKWGKTSSNSRNMAVVYQLWGVEGQCLHDWDASNFSPQSCIEACDSTTKNVVPTGQLLLYIVLSDCMHCRHITKKPVRMHTTKLYANHITLYIPEGVPIQSSVSKPAPSWPSTPIHSCAM